MSIDREDTEEIKEMRPRSARRASKRVFVLVAVLLGALLVAAAGVAYAGYSYAKEYAGRILPGATIAGVDVGGMTAAEARAAVKEAVEPQLEREITLTWNEREWTVTPEELGAHGDARAAVDAALATSERATFMEKVRMRVLGDDLGFDRHVAITYPRQGAAGFIEGIAASLDRDPIDAAIDYSTGWVEITKAKEGRRVRVGKARAALLEALRDGDDDEVALDVKTLEPEVTEDEFDQVLLVRIGENKLYLYEDGEITRDWTVATGLPEYPTPQGLFEVTLKRYMPTWVNPSPDTWGKDLPASIPPGPNNPLGLRAINWDAPAIRFHGTQALYSLGYNASHGCVRMANEDVIELYDLIDVGTPIVSVAVAPPKPLYGVTTLVDEETTKERKADGGNSTNDDGATGGGSGGGNGGNG